MVGWILMQVAALLENSLNLPAWFDTVITAALLIGFPIAMLLAWAFEMTPEGVKRTEHVKDGESVTDQTGRKLDFAIIGGLVIVGALVIGSRFMPQKMAAPDMSVQAETPTLEADEKLSIAVLPFEDFSPGNDQEYFANGISEELLNVLARIDGLRVSSRTSAFAFKDRKASTGEIAEALNVGHILEGSIRKAGATLRITAQLIDTKTDEHMWSETYDRPLTAQNIFAVQDEIAAAIVAELKGRLSIGENRVTDRTASLEAYELYLRAREQMQKRLPDTLSVAVKGYKEVIALDPQFAPAYAGLADAYLLMDEYAGMDGDEAIELARPNVDQAIRLAPNSAEALTAAASLANRQNKYQDGLDFTQRAITANPNYVLAYHRQGLAYGGLMQPEKALASFQKALELDPLSAVILSNVGSYQERLGNQAAARATHEKNIKYNPISIHGYGGLAGINYANGDYVSAHTLLKDGQALNPEAVPIQSALADIYLVVGMFSEVSAVSKRPVDIAEALILSGQKEQGLKRARDNLNNPNMAYALFLAGDVKGAYPYAQKFVTESNGLQVSANRNNVGGHATIAFIYQENGDADAIIMAGKVQTYLGADADPADKEIPNDLRAGIILHLIKGDADAAYAWIDRYLDLGLSNANFLETPPFGPLRGTPEFARREARMAENVARHRSAIEAQLASPKPNWIKLTP